MSHDGPGVAWEQATHSVGPIKLTHKICSDSRLGPGWALGTVRAGLIRVLWNPLTAARGRGPPSALVAKLSGAASSHILSWWAQAMDSNPTISPSWTLKT